MLLAVLPMQAAQAQMPRPFPATALRGTLQITQPPEALVNGQPARLAPGARIRDEQNLVQLSGRFVGQTLVVHYTVENGTGLLKDLWILRPDELAKKPWPATPAEAAAWRFDAPSQTWTKP
ncbi:MAG: hypothetical protein KBC73_24220 [Burkholderiaceae bacterium]|nr:hypothetical protein [Burkholderiaceae bacterium]